MKKAIHYINQFFGQIGGEDKADFEPEIRAGVVGPGLLLNNLLGPEVEVTHTVICGDNFFASNKQAAIDTILGFLSDKEFDIFIAGPAFMAGRYGFACGEICKAVKEKFGVPVVTSMNVENPAVEMFRKVVYIFSGGDSAGAMRNDVPTMTRFVKKLISGGEILPAKEEGHFPQGIRLESLTNSTALGADRVVDMLLKKLNGEAFVTEMPMPKVDQVPISPAVDISKSIVAVVNSGGIVPMGNPDRIQSASATKWGKYDISGFDSLKAGEWQTIHAGFDPTFANKNPNVVVPLDALRQYEKEGKIGKLHDYVYSTVGTGTSQADASRMGQEIAQQLREANVSAVVLTST
jgi:glycine/betaine/sarcosine/D-proline reductase family selenoprotein B